jgi:predicted O-methyltransferase YrrM
MESRTAGDVLCAPRRELQCDAAPAQGPPRSRMHPILEEIYVTKTVTDGTSTYSALNPDNQKPTYMDRAEGALLQRMIAEVRPTTTLEIGMAYGVSSLFICEALSHLQHRATHIVMDPFQGQMWRNIGLRNVRTAGYGEMLRFFAERSEYCLPRLLQQGTQVQVALIDGVHTFDQCALEFYYIDRMLPVGGVIIFDDVSWPAVRRAVRYVLSHGTYVVRDHTGPAPKGVTVFGRIRRALGQSALARILLSRDLLVPDWDVGIAGSCVAVIKTALQSPTYGDDRRFNEF